TCPEGHAAIAASICAAVLPGSRDAQIAVRFGMPPGMPAWLQSIAREGSRIPDHGSAAARTVTSPPTVRAMHRTRAIPSDRRVHVLPTSRVLTAIPAEPAAMFVLPSAIEHPHETRRQNPFDS